MVANNQETLQELHTYYLFVEVISEWNGSDLSLTTCRSTPPVGARCGKNFHIEGPAISYEIAQEFRIIDDRSSSFAFLATRKFSIEGNAIHSKVAPGNKNSQLLA